MFYNYTMWSKIRNADYLLWIKKSLKTIRWLAWNEIMKKYNLHTYKKETPAQVFSCELCEILQNSFLKEHVWMVTSDLGKHLKTLAIIFELLGSEVIWKPYLKHNIVWKKIFLEKYVAANMYHGSNFGNRFVEPGMKVGIGCT